MRTYEVTLTNDKLTVTMVIDGKKTSTIIIPTSEHEVLESALEELLEYAYLDGKIDERISKQA